MGLCIYGVHSEKSIIGHTVPSGLGTGNIGKAHTTLASRTRRPARSHAETIRSVTGDHLVGMKVGGAPKGRGSDTPFVVMRVSHGPSGSLSRRGGTNATSATAGCASRVILLRCGSNRLIFPGSRRKRSGTPEGLSSGGSSSGDPGGSGESGSAGWSSSTSSSSLHSQSSVPKGRFVI